MQKDESVILFTKYVDNIGKMAYLMKFLRNEGEPVGAPMKIIGHLSNLLVNMQHTSCTFTCFYSLLIEQEGHVESKGYTKIVLHLIWQLLIFLVLDS